MDGWVDGWMDSVFQYLHIMKNFNISWCHKKKNGPAHGMLHLRKPFINHVLPSGARGLVFGLDI